ncbi:MAG: hypothetical protein ACYSOC_05535 [Planctomycetota bacterium]
MKTDTEMRIGFLGRLCQLLCVMRVNIASDCLDTCDFLKARLSMDQFNRGP